MLLLLPFVFLLTVTVAKSNSAFSRNLPLDNRSATTQQSASLINFATSPQANKSDQLTSRLLFGVVSDIHVQSSNPIAQDKFRQMLGDMVKLQVPNLVINGDLGDGTPQDYYTLGNLIKQQTNHPIIYYTIGNHEFYKAYHDPITNAWSPETFPNGETEAAALNRFLGFTRLSQVYYDQYLMSYHFIFLGSEKSAISDHTYGDKAYLSAAQLSWLKSKLIENYLPGKPIFVFLHQPLLQLGSASNRPNFIIQEDLLREILNQFPEVIFFNGHLHHQLSLPTTILKERFVMVNSSSVSLPRNSNGQALPNQSEGLIVEVIKNKVVIKGRDFLNKLWIPGTQYEF